MGFEWIYTAQTVSRTWAAAAESVTRVLADSKDESNVDLSRKILLAIGFKSGDQPKQ